MNASLTRLDGELTYTLNRHIHTDRREGRRAKKTLSRKSVFEKDGPPNEIQFGGQNPGGKQAMFIGEDTKDATLCETAPNSAGYMNPRHLARTS